MSPRVGTIVALVAAVLLAVSILFPWWSGHPVLDGKQFDRKTAHVSLITGSQCNYTDGEETDCKHLTVGGTFGALKYVELGVVGLLVVSLVGSGLTRRRGLARLVMVAGALASLMFVVLLVVGPDMKTGKTESMPLAFPIGGLGIFVIGMGLAIFAGVVTLVPPREVAPVVQQWNPPSVGGRMPSQPNQPPAFNVEDLLAQDTLRPAALGPEPVIGKPQSPGGLLPGPAGPLSPPTGPQPLFQSAPQLRPLYETAGGFVPPAPPQFPTRGPTPMPQAAVRALVDLGEAPAPAPPAAKLPPPSRTRPLSAAPPIPPRTKPPTKPPPIPRGQATQLGTAVPMPLRQSDPGDQMLTSDFERASNEDTAVAEERPLDETFSGDTDVRDSTADIPTSAQPRVSKTAIELIGRAETTPAPVLVDPRGSNAVLTSARAPIPAKTPAPTQVPLSTAPESLPPPAADEQTAGGPSPACPQCESPMAWVEEHLRFYCKSCRMYF